MALTGYDLDGVITAGVEPDPGAVVITGRTFAEYDQVCKDIAQRFPLYIRGVGEHGDHEHAGLFKSVMVKMLGVTKFYEDEPVQAEMIQSDNPDCEVIVVGHS